MNFRQVFVPRKPLIEVFFIILLIKNGVYVFLIKLGLILFMPLWKEFQILKDLFAKHLIKLILYKNDGKLLEFKRTLSTYLI